MPILTTCFCTQIDDEDPLYAAVAACMEAYKFGSVELSGYTTGSVLSILDTGTKLLDEAVDHLLSYNPDDRIGRVRKFKV